jgi:hypothetical protein
MGDRPRKATVHIRLFYIVAGVYLYFGDWERDLAIATYRGFGGGGGGFGTPVVSYAPRPMFMEIGL